MLVKQLSGEYAEEYRELRLKALKEHPDAYSSSYEEKCTAPLQETIDQLNSGSSYTFGAFKHKKLIGVVTLIPYYALKLRHKALIVAVYVNPMDRRGGAAGELMRTAIRQAYQLEHVEQILLTVAEGNAGAKGLYTSLGFKTYGVEKKALKIKENYINEEYMLLELKKNPISCSKF
ncbi:GNAT family N-acetyltransferase [Jeotgalibacillus proteolyticus]|uniref:GNAT family N-acetyltransferase n=1 Tax=Jeotgalibacillus proteolyticus TaxID=2082395 RepID=A0A2S5GCJ1_9BACL|nr:GNAT family N-acetyltransferase [Jeotgalibacillus proteolyticus]PPA70716.1 GNAT family N-acetyltransferase [Jeotgalibacillus proteolyticus]